MAGNSLFDIARNYANGLAEKPWPYTDPRAFAQGMGTAPSEDAARIGASFLPGIGDAVGLAQDVAGFYTNPETRSPLNALLSLAALVPAIPSTSGKRELFMWERAEKFNGKAAGIDQARTSLAGLALGRNFGESMEDYLARSPHSKLLYDSAMKYLKDNGAL